MGGTRCPFCGFEAQNEYEILFHLEDRHPEGESPFVAKDGVKAEGEEDDRDDPPLNEYADCPVDGCGEIIHIFELESHVDMHAAESEDAEAPSEVDEHQTKRLKCESIKSNDDPDTRTSEQSRYTSEEKSLGSLGKSSSDRQAAAKKGWKELLNMPNADHTRRKSQISAIKEKINRRLGNSELGPHANEDQMPAWLRKLLESDGEPRSVNQINAIGAIKKVEVLHNYTPDIIPVLVRLLHQDRKTEYAYTCHPSVKHISKLKNEGGFCGYRNIQMLSSYLIATEYKGSRNLGQKIPTIFQIQDLIERAWVMGINKQGRLETGGIRGTRKYIGTPEAQAMLCSLEIPCNAQGFRGIGDIRADELLLDAVEDYYRSGCTKPQDKVRRTLLPPIYFQHPGHSLTIVGIERQSDGSRNLLVFDPMFHVSTRVTTLIGKRFHHKNPGSLLKAYRRGKRYLRKYNEFEILRLPQLEEQTQKT